MATKQKANGFNYVGMGLVTENKPLSTKVIMVTPIELTPGIQGDLSSQNIRSEVKGKDAQGKEFNSVYYTNNSKEAIWLPDDTFRLTAPDVRRGEKVRLYRYGDSNTWYWKEMGDGKGKRRGETIVLGASGYLEMPANGLPPDVSAVEDNYRIEFSGHGRFINLVTAGKNGEVSVYNLLLDGGKGRISLADQEGNEFVLDTRKIQWALRNKEGSYVILDKKNVMIGCEQDIVAQSKRQIAFQAKKIFMKSELFTLIADKIMTKGQWFHEGDINVKGGWTFQGEGKAIGNIHTTGKITADTDVVAGAISLLRHYHNCPDGQTTQPVG